MGDWENLVAYYDTTMRGKKSTGSLGFDPWRLPPGPIAPHYHLRLHTPVVAGNCPVLHSRQYLGVAAQVPLRSPLGQAWRAHGRRPFIFCIALPPHTPV
jgi:hypothetical protein